MLGRVVSCASNLLVQQLGASAARGGFLQQAAAAAGCSGLLQKLGQSSGYATNSHDIFNIHKHSPHNNWNTEFDFTPDNYKRVRL
jgi:NADH dehydrogenase (ubiquinone) flavoprotein 2